MSRNDLWKWLVLAILAVLSAYVVIPPKDKIRLGLDLSGGTSFTVAIDEEKLRNNIKTQRVLEAALIAARTKRWVSLSGVK